MSDTLTYEQWKQARMRALSAKATLDMEQVFGFVTVSPRGWTDPQKVYCGDITPKASESRLACAYCGSESIFFRGDSPDRKCKSCGARRWGPVK